MDECRLANTAPYANVQQNYIQDPNPVILWKSLLIILRIVTCSPPRDFDDKAFDQTDFDVLMGSKPKDTWLRWIEINCHFVR